jgi:glycosyltransferase involved in cell wall biosynthesis
VCDDGSTDTTAACIAAIQKKYPEASVVLLTHPINRGPGAANRTLFAYAKQYGAAAGIDRRVTYDADGQMYIDDMQVFMDAISVSKEE